MSPPGTKHESKSTKENLQRGANQNTSPMQAHVVRLQRQSFAEAVKATTASSVAAVTSSAVATSSKIVTSSAISQSPTLATSTSSKVEPSIGSKSPLSTLLNNEQSLTDMMKLNLPNLGAITTEDLEQRKLKIQSQYGPLPPIDQNGNVAPKRPQSLVNNNNNNNNNNNDNNNNNNNNNIIVPQSTKMAQLAMEAKSVRDRQIQSTATPTATRALTPFALFIKQQYPVFAAKNPTLKVFELMPKIAAEWKTLSADKRSPFDKAAAVDKERAAADRARIRAQFPPKPLTGYMKFVQAQRAVVQKSNPTLSFAELGRELGKRWRALSNADKEKFKK